MCIPIVGNEPMDEMTVPDCNTTASECAEEAMRL